MEPKIILAIIIITTIDSISNRTHVPLNTYDVNTTDNVENTTLPMKSTTENFANQNHSGNQNSYINITTESNIANLTMNISSIQTNNNTINETISYHINFTIGPNENRTSNESINTSNQNYIIYIPPKNITKHTTSKSKDRTTESSSITKINTQTQPMSNTSSRTITTPITTQSLTKPPLINEQSYFQKFLDFEPISFLITVFSQTKYWVALISIISFLVLVIVISCCCCRK